MSCPHFICLIVHSMLTWVGESPLNSYNFDWIAKISCQQYLSKHHMRVFINLVYMCDMHTRRSFLLAIMLEIFLCMGNENNFDHFWHVIHICIEVDIGMVRMSLNGAWMRNWDFLEQFKTSIWSLFLYLFMFFIIILPCALWELLWRVPMRFQDNRSDPVVMVIVLSIDAYIFQLMNDCIP